jgi:tetratricopeptide (TPR) repeat protein
VPDVDLNELERYLRIYQENPDSRVFAPLADMYRRLGKFSEAEQICREGLQRHPYYAGGKVALAYVLLDTVRLEEARTEIEAVVTYYPDNLLARKILVRVLAGLGDLERARREFEALKQMAPQLAKDPELETALQQGPAAFQKLREDVENKKKSSQSSMRESLRETVEPTEADAVAQMDQALSGAFDERSRRLAALYKKKAVLESWLRKLGDPSSLR